MPVVLSAASVATTCDIMETMVLTPDLGVPIPEKINYPDLFQRAKAACATAQLLGEHGVDVTPNQEAKDVAAAIVTSYAQDPDKTDKAVTIQNMATLPPAAVMEINELLQEFSHPVIKHAMQLRYLVTNKLILETKSTNPHIRLRALELLGKFAEVGLFVERQEITITHQSTDDLKRKLREKLDALTKKTDDVQDVVDVDGEFINVKEELGLEEDKPEEKEVIDEQS